MNEGHVEAFLVTAELLNVTEAARALYLTQPALTHRIQSLERELGVTLFERTAQGVALTEAGRALVGPARDIQEASRRARARMAAFSGKRAITLGCNAMMVSVDADLFGAIIEGLHLRHPGHNFDIRLFQTDFNLSILDEDKADIAFMHLGHAPDARTYGSRRCHNPECYVMVSKKSPLAQRERVTVADVAGQAIYASSADPDYTAPFVQMLMAATRQRVDIRPVPSLAVTPGFVARGDGIALYPRAVETKSVRCVPLDMEYDFPIYTVWLKRREDALLRSVADVMVRMDELHYSRGIEASIAWLTRGDEG